MVNKVTLIGNLGQAPEIKVLENGVKVARLSVATNENYKDKNGEWQTVTEWHKVILWRWLADRAESQSKKGSTVYINGKLTTRKYEKDDGTTQYFTEVVGSDFKVLDKRETTGNFPSSEDAPPLSTSAKDDTPDTNTGNTAGSTEDDLPF